MQCRVCKQPIPPARLKAVPHTKVCVSCLTAAGDIPKIKRFDDYNEDGEVVSTHYTVNRAMDRFVNRLRVGLSSNPAHCGERVNVTFIKDYRHSVLIPFMDVDHRVEYQESRFE